MAGPCRSTRPEALPRLSLIFTACFYESCNLHSNFFFLRQTKFCFALVFPVRFPAVRNKTSGNTVNPFDLVEVRSYY